MRQTISFFDLIEIRERNQAKKQKENFHEVFLAFEYEYSKSNKQANWLILPVIIFFDQRLSHACPRLSKSLANLRMAHYMNYHLPQQQLTIG
jgi:hypothetical protein